jgi:hypothetical protein
MNNLPTVGKPRGKRPIERPKGKWKDNIRTDFGGIRL